MSTDLQSTQAFSISDVDRDTGLAKETLRVWERRYAFPQPQRDAYGERSYPFDQVQKLRMVKHLLDMGYRRIGQNPVAKVEDIGPSPPLDQHLFDAAIKSGSACAQKQRVQRALNGCALL